MKLNKNCMIIYILLFLSIAFVFGIFNLLNNQSKMYIDLFGNRECVNEDILIEENGEYYLSYEYIKANIDSEIYYDNVSKKVVITSDKCLLKVKINENKVTNNFEEENLQNLGVIEEKYISLEVLRKAYDYNIYVFNNIIYICPNNEFECTTKLNGVKIYENNSLKSKIVDYVDKNIKLTGIIEKDNFVLIKTEEGMIGYVPNELLEYEISHTQEEKYEEEKSKKYLYADGSTKYIDKELMLDGIFVNMFEITQRSCEISIKSDNLTLLTNVKSNGYNTYGIVTNGYNLAGFNTNTLSQILADESKRLLVINNLVENAEQYDLDGIVIDFRMIKESDVDNFIQFVKEFKAFYEKEVVVNISANEYQNYISAIKYSDFSVINYYGLRDLNSTVAGSISEFLWMQEITTNILEVAPANKVVACIPSYSILWTEKNGKVVDAKIYNFSAEEDYISKNNLTKKYIENLRQNYVELTKGSLIYKMWVEDEISIKNKVDYINECGLKGVAIYKLGYENSKILDVINENLR